jgi:hypothetical protein
MAQACLAAESGGAGLFDADGDVDVVVALE